MRDIEKDAMDYLKQYENTDAWEQTDIVSYVLDKAVSMGMVSYNTNYTKEDEIDKTTDAIMYKLMSGVHKNEKGYILNIYFTYNERQFNLFISDYNDRRYKEPVQLFVFHEIEYTGPAYAYFYRKVIKHAHGLPANGLNDYIDEILDMIWDFMTTDLYKTNPKLEMALEAFSTKCAIDHLE
jgi:hypothetical protein